MAARQLSDGNEDGTVLGQGASDKVAFFGATPVAQPAAVSDATSEDAHTQLNLLLAKLRQLGLIASS